MKLDQATALSASVRRDPPRVRLTPGVAAAARRMATSRVLPLSVWYVALRIDEPSCPRGADGSVRSRRWSESQ